MNIISKLFILIILSFIYILIFFNRLKEEINGPDIITNSVNLSFDELAEDFNYNNNTNNNNSPNYLSDSDKEFYLGTNNNNNKDNELLLYENESLINENVSYLFYLYIIFIY